MPPALLALAPVVAKGAQTLIQHKQQGAANKTAAAQAKQDALAADAQAKLDWEEKQNSPAAQMARFKNTFALGKLGGKLGGIDKVPKSIAAYYNAQRAMPTYTGQSSYREPVKASGGGWNIAAGIADALGQYSPSSFAKPKSAALPAATGFGAGSSFGNEFKTGQLASVLSSAAPAVTSFTRQPWDQTQLQYSTPGSRMPTVFSPSNYDPKTGRAF